MTRHTKIVATIGPASENEDTLTALMDAGVSVFRLNFSHGDLENKGKLIDRIRRLSDKRQNAVAILADLQGPKIRVGQLEGGSMTLKDGWKVGITTDDVIGCNYVIPTTYKQLPDDVNPGDQILLDDGLLELEVVEVSDGNVHCNVVHGGVLKDRKGINLPGVEVSAPSLTDKDLVDLGFCIEKDVDYVALSFVRKASDVSELKRILNTKKSDIKVISKIEKPEAVKDFDEILAQSDGIMVARGDLGVEIQAEKVPLIQKEIIRKCNNAGKPVITATQMLESMISNPRPTRAETSDVANAILDGTDAVMLSGETASGKYPVEAVEVMAAVATDVEKALKPKQTKDNFNDSNPDIMSLSEVIGHSACQMSRMVGAAAILAFTQTGSTATLVAKHRPEVPVFAMTPDLKVRRQLALYSGVQSLQVEIKGGTESQIASVTSAAVEAGVLNAGDLIVLTMGSPISTPGTTNLIKVHELS